MKKLYCFFVALFSCLCASSQVVTIPDANFKAMLLEASPSNGIAQNMSNFSITIDANNDQEIQVSEAIQVGSLTLNGTFIHSLEGITSFSNLVNLHVWADYNGGASIPILNLSGLSNLKYLNCYAIGLETLNLTGVTNLERLDCVGNNFTTLDLSGFGLTNLKDLNIAGNESLITLNANGLPDLERFYFNGNDNLEELYVSGNQLTNFDITSLPSLTILECKDNLLASLAVTGFPNLEYLDCSGNQLQTLNLNNLTHLQSLNCSNNQLTLLLINNGANEGSLNIAGNPGLLFVCTDSAQVSNVQSLVTSYGYTNCLVDSDCQPQGLDYVIIPDIFFKEKLLEADSNNEIAKNLNGDYFKIDANNDLQIQLTEAIQVSWLFIDDHSLHSVEGIVNFTNLQHLGFGGGAGNRLSFLDVGGLSNLKYLNCAYNGVHNINLTGLTNLEELYCGANALESLDVSGLINLKILSVGSFFDVPLTSLDVRNLSNLEQLQINGLVNLHELYISGNQLTSLNLDSAPNLATLEVTDNPLTVLDVSALTALQNFDCSGNQLQTMNVNALTNLQTLNCSDNQLTSLYLKNGVNETSLNMAGNPGLLYVCADTAQLSNVQTLITSYGYTNCVVDAACSSSPSDFITIPDANFKAKLLAADSSNFIAKDLNGQYFKIDANNDAEIQETEAAQVSYLDVKVSSIASLEGISSFTNLLELNCRTNQLTELNIGELTNLQDLRCSDNQIATLDLNGVPNLLELHCSGNQLTELNTDGVPNLEELHAENNLFTTLNVSNLHNLMELHCSGNPLVSLFIKNGMAEELEIENNPGLVYICADEFQLPDVQTAINTNGYINCTANTYCSFTPGGNFYTIQGDNKNDTNGNGCDASDLAFPNAKFVIINGATTNTVIATATGSYNFSVEEGTHTITPVFENPSYYNVTPSSVAVTFPAESSPFIQNFCYTPNGVHPDLEVTVVPITEAVPGFDADFRIIYKNKGTTTQSGTVNLTFDDAVQDFVSANPLGSSQTINALSWNFINLQPFETRVINFALNINSPMETPPVNNGDVLEYIATISSQVTDETPADNTFTLNQTVVNSFDPNDKTCLEGTKITMTEVGDYVHYMIRFENSGTFPATNIVVKDMLDTNKFDVNSLVAVKGSHAYYTNSKENKVEFIFENINLPFDDANNDGFVVFKIKTKATLVVGDTFSNSASIYFDYNFPIETNTATTTIKENIKDYSFSGYFMMYPNPVKDVLTIEAMPTVAISSINIYNQLGQLVLVVPSAQDVSKVDVSSLASGNYFIKINSNKETLKTRFIKM